MIRSLPLPGLTLIGNARVTDASYTRFGFDAFGGHGAHAGTHS